MTFLRLAILFTFCVSFGQTNDDYAKWENTIDKGIELFDAEKYSEALPILEDSYIIARNIFTQNEGEFGETAYQLAYTYDIIKSYKKAIPLYLEALNNLRFNNEEQEPYFIQTLLRVGTIYGFIGDFDKSINALEEGLKLIENSQGKNNLDYSKTLINISIAYKKAGDYEKAIECNNVSNDIIKQLHGVRSAKYAQNLTSLSQIYIEIGEYDKASEILNNALSILKTKEQKGIAYIQAIFTLSVLHHNTYDFEKEIQLLEEVKTISGVNDRAYISANSNLSVAYTEMGDFENALKIALEVANSTSEDDANHPTRLQNLAFNYAELGEFNKALETYEKALASCRSKLGTNHPLYAKLVDCIGQLYLINGDLDRAKELFEEALLVILKNFDEDHSEYGFYLNHYTNTLLGLNQYNEAIDLMIENIKISQENSKTEDIAYYRKQLSLAKAYNKVENYKEALIILENYSEKIKEKLGNEHADYGDVLNSLWNTYLGLGEIEKAIPIIDASNNVIISQIDKVFKFRSEKEKQSFLKITNQNFDKIQSIAFNFDKQIEQLNEINLDNQIMLKGLLLNNSKNLLTQLSTLNNSDINNKILSYRSSKTNLANVLSLPNEARTFDVDSLKDAINSKESELVKIYSTRFQDTINLKQSWKQSQPKLNHNDIAIEFSSFHYSNKNRVIDSILYVAYVFKKDWKFPKMVPLFEERQLKTILSKKAPNQLYVSRGSKVTRSTNTAAIYDLVWKPLEKYVESNGKIYFAPSGLLNQISIAALQKEGEKSLSLKHDLFQLSSTGVLEKDDMEPNISSALFIGGINYDFKSASIENDNENQILLNNRGSFNESRSTKSRGESWTYLQGTLKEVEALRDNLQANGSNVTLWSGREATETNFKKLSGKSPNILHIATHGFFYENIKAKNQSGLSLSSGDQYRLSEDPLLRSGLIFAGANYAWKLGHRSFIDDDGVLTSLEISNLDLSKTDIVVLSACETGLGDIDGSEGVYGLQRAFKMAGVKIVVMSLWQVPDIETAEFMNLFYKNWMQSKKVKEAFNVAQRTMQLKYKEEPFKWAAFVLFQ